MKPYLHGFYYSFPVQLLLLHLKKFQILLIFWYLLFSTVNSSFMKSFGADSLFLAPEYLGDVNAMGTAITGVAIGVFVMSWNITTFILFSRHFRFLATTTNPFLKYCINNAVLPLIFLLFYLFRAVQFGTTKELKGAGDIVVLALGFLAGLAMLLLVSLIYFFRYDRTILKQLRPVISNPQLFTSQFKPATTRHRESRLIRVDYYLQSPFTIKKVRDVSHYSKEFIDAVLNRHHFAAVLSIFIAFIFLVMVGFMMDHPLFQLPAAAGITIFFAILIALTGAFSYFLQTWSVPFLFGLFIVLNILYRYEIIDTSNKAYGLNYGQKPDRPQYNRAALLELSDSNAAKVDRDQMLNILNAWKKKQPEEKPLFYLIVTSGGGSRSATFTMNVLQRLDSIMNGQLSNRTFLMTGASGGMLGATYFRELCRLRSMGQEVDLRDPKYANDIAQDLLNPLFSSFVARDLASPAQKFTVNQYSYIKDRGYAFEQKLDRNTRGYLNKQLKDYVADEKAARIPLLLFNSVVTRDGRKMIVSSQPLRFMMRPVADSAGSWNPDPDVIDYLSFFRSQDPLNLRVLTAMRMNATFPYVLPNVWLPSRPVIDVMDAGLRDNFGQETAIRFLQNFSDWLKENTSGVVLIQLRDRKEGGWEHPYEATNISEIVTRPMMLLQNNWYKMQEYNQNDLLSLTRQLLGPSFHKVTFQYSPRNEESGAAMNFHLTKREKQDVAEAVYLPENKQAFGVIRSLLAK